MQNNISVKKLKIKFFFQKKVVPLQADYYQNI